MYAGCVSGAVQRSESLQMIKAAGFSKVEVKLSKPITLPLNVLTQYLSPAEAAAFAEQASAISSATVVGGR